MLRLFASGPRYVETGPRPSDKVMQAKAVESERQINKSNDWDFTTTWNI